MKICKWCNTEKPETDFDFFEKEDVCDECFELGLDQCNAEIRGIVYGQRGWPTTALDINEDRICVGDIVSYKDSIEFFEVVFEDAAFRKNYLHRNDWQTEKLKPVLESKTEAIEMELQIKKKWNE